MILKITISHCKILSKMVCFLKSFSFSVLENFIDVSQRSGWNRECERELFGLLRAFVVEGTDLINALFILQSGGLLSEDSVDPS